MPAFVVGLFRASHVPFQFVSAHAGSQGLSVTSALPAAFGCMTWE